MISGDYIMKLISWNCNMAFRKKCEIISQYNADILIIQECENPNVIKYPEEFINIMPYFLWEGDNNNKGLGIFSKIPIEKNLWTTNNNKYFISCKVGSEFNLVGVWCMKNKVSKLSYMGQFYNYFINNYDEIVKSKILISGDFNSFKNYTSEKQLYNHMNVIKKLEDNKIKSIYHEYFKLEQGNERDSTTYNTKRIDKGYHVDYIFGSRIINSKVKYMEVGKFDEWIQKSDHMPLIIEFDL